MHDIRLALEDDTVAKLRAAWLQCWDMVGGEQASVSGVEVAVPWESFGPPGTVRGMMEGFRETELQRIVWLGYHPARGLLKGETIWMPMDSPAPLLPKEWQPYAKQTGLSEDKFWEPHEELRFPRAVLASIDPRASSSIRGVQLRVEMLPLRKLVEAMQIPARAYNLSQTRTYIRNMDVYPRMHDLRRPDFDLVALRWCAGNDSSSSLPLETVRERRIQALLAAPCFAKGICTAWITGAVDRGEELIPALASNSALQRSTVRIMGAATAAMDGRRLSMLIDMWDGTIFRTLMDALPRDTLRAMAGSLTGDEWRGVHALSRTLDGLEDPHLVSQAIGKDLRALPGSGWDWLVPEEGDRWRHLADVASALSRDLIWPVEAMWDERAQFVGGRQQHASQELAVLALLSLGPIKLARVLDAHMTGTLRRASEVSTGGTGLTWPIPSDPVMMRDGKVIRFLSSAQELAEEGVKMGHCVGDYTDTCVTARSAIMSIGHWEGTEWHPTSTVELKRDKQGELVVGQHFGPRNDDPSHSDEAVLGGWMADVSMGIAPFDHTVLPANGPETHISMVLGTAWNTPEYAESRWDHWRRVMDVRHASLGDFLENARPMIVVRREEGDRGQAMQSLIEMVQGQGIQPGVAPRP